VHYKHLEFSVNFRIFNSFKQFLGFVDFYGIFKVFLILIIRLFFYVKLLTGGCQCCFNLAIFVRYLQLLKCHIYLSENKLNDYDDDNDDDDEKSSYSK